ncbi:MAG: serine acetyltransferase, partial [Planctomycetaceae bacterium]|nr:serine acetyltransferase [Planctomycetaceae bacterium]
MATDIQRKEQLPNLTDRIVESYLEIGTMNHLGHCPLPSPEAIVDIAQDLKDVIFPGYRRRQNLHMGNVVYHVGDLIDGLHDKLTTHIARALSHAFDLDHGLQCEEKRKVDFESQGQQKALDFLETVPNLRRMLAMDVQAAYDGDPAASGLDEIIFCY